MKHLDQFLYTLLLAVALITFPAALNAEELIDHSSSIFKFQQSLAENGNVQAQYKLALMYEKGEGVEASFDKALHWYDRAAKSGLLLNGQRAWL
jgi:TPR repeat protein